MRIGVLALQGDFDAHVKALRRAGPSVDAAEVRRPAELEGLDGLVLPGGESTTLLKLMAAEDLGGAIARLVLERGGALLATCAGAILISREVSGPAQASLGLLDAAIERNSYGRQVDSFIASSVPEPGLGSCLGEAPIEMVFIRAPRFLRLGPRVEVLLRQSGDPVLVRQDRVLAATFHPEMTSDPRVHALFLAGAAAAAAERVAPAPARAASRTPA